MGPLRRALPLTVLLALAPGAALAAQEQAPTAAAAAPAFAPGNWWLLDAAADHFYGTSAERAYHDLLAGRRPARGVVVAIIDSGIDTAHTELHDYLWRNPKEQVDGRDDDGDGLADDVRGWDFIGGPGGKDVKEDSFEMTRRFAVLRKQFQAPNPDTASAQGRADYAEYLKLQAKIEQKRDEAKNEMAQLGRIAPAVERATEILRRALGSDSLTAANVSRLQPTTPDVIMARAQYLQLAEAGITPTQIRMAQEEAQADLQYHLNPDFDPRAAIVGDDYANTAQRNYGNSDVVGPDAMHGTHVAGIVLGVPGNRDKLADGTPAVRIMVLRAVPDGDERDKDIANAIRYATDHGANIISMSFGKGISPQKGAVDDAAKYADAHGVLLVHAAGNDAANLDTAANFPNRYFQAGGEAADWVEVGASSWRGADALAAPFSNYSHTRVDVFAPGVDILSTVPGNGHERLSGTSMAAPVVSGIAAMLMAYYPSLTAVQVKQIVLQSATRYADQMVARPAEDGGEAGGATPQVRFGDLSATGGIVNAYAAVQAAQQQAGQPAGTPGR